MRILGVDLLREPPPSGTPEHTLVVLDGSGRVSACQRCSTLPEVAAAVAQLVGDEPFLLGANVPVVVPAKAGRARAVEKLVRRRLGFRLSPGGRAALGSGPLGVPGEALIAGLATAGLPCLLYPDRDRRRNGLAEAYPGLTLKALLWESSRLSSAADPAGSEELFRAFGVPSYRAAAMSARSGWAEQAVAIELALRVLRPVAGFDWGPATEQLERASSREEVERAAAVLDAALIAGTARRYLEAPESCIFIGDQESGYVILPADGLIRRLVLNDTRPPHGELFPQASLKERLGESARLHSPDLLSVPGHPQRLEATFTDSPRYEFDNLDEMMWWKHCRHLAGPRLPTEGLQEFVVALDAAGGRSPLRLARSRHRTLSFRFDPPKAWRRYVPTRDGKTYPFRVLRAVYDTLPAKS